VLEVHLVVDRVHVEALAQCQVIERARVAVQRKFLYARASAPTAHTNANTHKIYHIAITRCESVLRSAGERPLSIW
jgi:hypothetical protein